MKRLTYHISLDHGRWVVERRKLRGKGFVVIGGAATAAGAEDLANQDQRLWAPCIATVKWYDDPAQLTLRKVMDRATAEHFVAWLDRYVAEDEQHAVEQRIHQLLRDHPTLVDEGRSWPELRELAERNYPEAS